MTSPTRTARTIARHAHRERFSIPANLRLPLVLLIVLAFVLAAFAPQAQALAQTARVTYVTAVWWAQGTNQWPTEGQTLAAHVVQEKKVLDLEFVKAEAAKLGCGFTIQGDLYANDKTTKKLLDGGKLYGPSNPKESWPGGEYKSEFSTVFYTGDCPPVVPEKPAPVVTTGEWSSWSVDCDTVTAERGRWIRTQDWVLVDNAWFASEDLVETSETETRAATTDECPPIVIVPEYPGDKITHTNGELVPDCDLQTVSWLHLTFTSTGALVDNAWVYGQPVQTGSELMNRAMDATELAACPPVIVDPPIDPPVTEEPPVVVEPPVTASLVTTGVDPLVPALSALALLLLGGGLMVARRIRTTA